MTARVVESRQDSLRKFDCRRSVKDRRQAPRAYWKRAVGRWGRGYGFDYLVPVPVPGSPPNFGGCRSREGLRPLRFMPRTHYAVRAIPVLGMRLLAKRTKPTVLC
jgi:hypothetical protein